MPRVLLTVASGLAAAMFAAPALAQSPADSIPSILELAEQGNVSAIYMRGLMHETGEGLPLDLAQAARSYEEASSRGHGPANARLGYLYQTGAGVGRNHAKAFALYNQAAETQVEGQFLLALAHLHGVGTSRDATAGRKWLARAAGAGHQEAQVLLALMLQHGIGGRRNDFSAHRWLSRASAGPDEFLAKKAQEIRTKLGQHLLASDGVSIGTIIAVALGVIALADLADDSPAGSQASTYNHERQMRRLRQEHQCTLRAYTSTRTLQGMLSSQAVCQAGIY